MSDQPKGVFIDDVEFPFDDSSSILAFTDKALGDKIIPTFVMMIIFSLMEPVESVLLKFSNQKMRQRELSLHVIHQLLLE